MGYPVRKWRCMKFKKKIPDYILIFNRHTHIHVHTQKGEVDGHGIVFAGVLAVLTFYML